jgi:isoleucyl-tRNA synthetase
VSWRTTLEVSAVSERPQRSDGTMFDGVPSSLDAPALERDVRSLWKRERVFERTLDRPAPRGPWVFYEGPPTANGRPGVHHVLSRAFKDVFPRFKTMQGHRVTRKGGWDTHGLPVEIAVEQELGFTNKQQIEDYGIAAFNQRCRDTVFAHIQDWNDLTERIAFWVDLESAYVTYHNGYIESCWWVMKALWDRGLLEEDYRTTWHSPSSNTTLASHEVSQGYRDDVPDPSVYPAFPAEVADLASRGLISADEARPVAYVAWTTTPWTLAANTGLAVHPEARYVVVEGRRRRDDPASEPALFVLAEALVPAVFGESPHRVLGSCLGVDLAGARYHPILRGRLDDDADAGAAAEGGWRVVADDFVTLDDGTGIVHLAPAYGDLEVGRRHGLPTAWSVDLTGRVMPEVRPVDAPEGGDGPYAGVWFKDADAAITRDLIEHGAMFSEGVIHHTYPFNWRDGTPLMNVVKKSWYVRTSRFRDQLLRTNDAINWYPDHIRTGRFGKWLEGNVDWALSRERYWGAPLPIWRGDDGSLLCVGSVGELAELAGRDLGDLDLHRPAVDEVVFEVGGVTYRREPYTVDVWFESGAMPYAQWHYTGEDGPAADALRSHFPADYICEAIDQTRGWFYSLHALATLLTHDGSDGLPRGPLADVASNTSSFKNVIVLGHIVDEKGEKMSKSKGNVVDPFTVLDAYGADALRWYLYASSPPEATKRFSTALVEETQRDLFATLSNTYGFFALYANLDRPDLGAAVDGAFTLSDKWLASRREALTRDVTAALEGFDATGAARAIRDFVVDDLSNWYVRRNRRRFWRGDGGDDALAAYRSLYDALVRVATLMAPLAPYMAERLWQDLVRRVDDTAAVSVHLADWPEADTALIDDALMRDVAVVQRLVELGRSARAASGHKVRQPLPEVLVRVRSDAERDGVSRLEDQLRDELNVKRVRYLDLTDAFLDYDLKPNLPLIGKRLGKRIPALRAALAAADPRAIASAVREGREVTFELGGERITLEPEALLLDARSPEGFAAVEDRGYLVALDTTLTPALVREGLARDAVRLVQDARKQAGLDVSDRIELWLRADDATAAQAIAEHGATLRSETLALALVVGDAEPEDAFALSATLGEGGVRIGLRRTSDRDTLP